MASTGGKRGVHSSGIVFLGASLAIHGEVLHQRLQLTLIDHLLLVLLLQLAPHARMVA